MTEHVWQLQSEWSALGPRTISHVDECLTEVRGGETTTIEQLAAQEDWHPWLLVSSFGMLRVGELTSALGEQWDWAPADSLCIGSVVVLERYRGLGHANYLMRALVARFGDRPLCLSVDPTNHPALSLYHRHGFRFMRDHDGYTQMLRAGPARTH